MERKSEFTCYLRRIFTEGGKYTIGQWWIDGHYICDTLEDEVRHLPETCPNTPKGIPCKCKEKVYAETAIPAGEYWCRVSYSPRFSPKSKKNYIEIMDVPHFLGIRVHSGTNKNHTEGCVLVGVYEAGANGVLKDSFKEMLKLEKEIEKRLIEQKYDVDGGFFKLIITNPSIHKTK